MSFFGKKFKKTKVENVAELLEALKIPENTLNLLKDINASTCFDQNDDGTIRYHSSVDDEVKFDQTITLEKESSYTTPDGVETKVKFTLEGDVLKSTLNIDDRVIHFDRVFEGDTMTMTITVEDTDLNPGIIYYAAA